MPNLELLPFLGSNSRPSPLKAQYLPESGSFLGFDQGQT